MSTAYEACKREHTLCCEEECEDMSCRALLPSLLYHMDFSLLKNLYLALKLASIFLHKDNFTQLAPWLLSNNCPISSFTCFYLGIACTGGPTQPLSSKDNVFFVLSLAAEALVGCCCLKILQISFCSAGILSNGAKHFTRI